MHILMLNHNVAWSGGTFYRAYHFARQMTRRGHEVTLLTISPHRRFGFRETHTDNIHLVETPDWLWGRGRTGWDAWDIIQRLQYVRHTKWDLIHAFDSRPVVILPALVAQHKRVPLVLDWADWWGRGGTIEERNLGPVVQYLVGPIETFFEEHFRTAAQSTTVITSALKQRAIHLGVPAKSITQIPQGSDVELIQPLPKAECRRALGLPEAGLFIGHVGALLKNDAQLLFRAFAFVRETQKCQLLLIGNHHALPPAGSDILDVGYIKREDLLRYMGACDLLLLPLRDTIASRGRWPSKFNDYVAAGRPIIATTVGDIANLFVKYNIGMAVPDIPDAFASAICHVLNDGEQREEMGRNARRVAEEVLNWDLIGGRIAAHYEWTMQQFSPEVASHVKSAS